VRVGKYIVGYVGNKVQRIHDFTVIVCNQRWRKNKVHGYQLAVQRRRAALGGQSGAVALLAAFRILGGQSIGSGAALITSIAIHISLALAFAAATCVGSLRLANGSAVGCLIARCQRTRRVSVFILAVIRSPTGGITHKAGGASLTVGAFGVVRTALEIKKERWLVSVKMLVPRAGYLLRILLFRCCSTSSVHCTHRACRVPDRFHPPDRG